MKILVVDDDKQLGARLCQHLGEYACEICPDFEQALHKVRDDHYDIIILDLFAGAVDEQNLAGDQILAQLWRHNFCPVIINSAAPDAGAIDKYCRNFFVPGLKKGKTIVFRSRRP
ncbi:MAG: hypothetical protein OXC81_07575 [Betaproteobacteria bacterium]|nr:hypothetical protein [Betaproteobacteria bacterium]